MAFSPQERAEAISKGAKKYFTGRTCKSGHVAEDAPAMETALFVKQKNIDAGLKVIQKK